MGKPTLKELIREFIARKTWKIFLWSIGMTADKYWTEVYHQERNRRCIDHRAESERLGKEGEEEKIDFRGDYYWRCKCGKEYKNQKQVEKCEH